MKRPDTSLRHQDASLRHQDASLRRPDTSLSRQDASLRHQDAFPGGRDAITKPQDRCHGRQTRGALTALPAATYHFRRGAIRLSATSYSRGSNMAKNEKVRLSPEIQQADENTFLALKAIAGYSPANPAYSLATVTARYDAMRAAAEVELRAQNALDAARDAAIAAQWEHHNLILGVKDQVIAQFGPDSDEVASLGLKKKSERKTPARSSKASK
jgi:hypothetical protein